jgi:translation initiation factor eIF-2B subunit beta
MIYFSSLLHTSFFFQLRQQIRFFLRSHRIIIISKSHHHRRHTRITGTHHARTHHARTPDAKQENQVDARKLSTHQIWKIAPTHTNDTMAPSAEEALSTLASIDTPSPDVRAWMAKQHPKQLALVDRFQMELRLGRLSTSSSTTNMSSTVTWDASDRRLMTSRTVELLRTLIGSTRWKNAAQLMVLLRGVGRELHAAGGFREPAIGNVVRRIMCAVRDEVAAAADAPIPGNNNKNDNDDNDDNDNDDEDMAKIDEMAVALPPTGRPMRDRGNALSLSTMLWAHPQHVKSARPSGNRSSNLRSDSFSSVGSGGGGATATPANANAGDLPFPPIFYANRPDLRQTIMEAIQEIMSDLEDMHKNINDQATSHIHAGEIILVYGKSRTIELVRHFLFCILRLPII